MRVTWGSCFWLLASKRILKLASDFAPAGVILGCAAAPWRTSNSQHAPCRSSWDNHVMLEAETTEGVAPWHVTAWNRSGADKALLAGHT